MSYCSIQTLKELLPKSVTIGSTSLVNETTTQKAATISTQTAGKFINLASQYIDSRLSTVYMTPVHRIKIWEETLVENFTVGSQTLKVTDNGPFDVGVFVRVSDGTTTTLFSVDEVYDAPANRREVKVTPVTPNTFQAGVAIVSIVEYPSPMSDMCARLAVSMIIDKEFVAQQAPDVSNYGKSMRTMAANALDKILTGAIRLDGQEFVSRRFVTTALRDTWNSSAEVQAGNEKE